MVDKQLRDCINAITVTDRFGERKKEKKNQIRTVEISCLHSALTYIQLDMTETVIAEVSQSVHHFPQQ